MICWNKINSTSLPSPLPVYLGFCGPRDAQDGEGCGLRSSTILGIAGGDKASLLLQYQVSHPETAPALTPDVPLLVLLQGQWPER